MNKQVTVVESRAIFYLLSKLRDKNTISKEFMIYGDRLMRILAEEVLCRLPSIDIGLIETPCGQYRGLIDHNEESNICAVSIVRSGDILLEAIRCIQPGIKVGKILIQRDESTESKTPVLYYKKLPKDINECIVILVDPMLATGGSARKAISVLLESGILQEQIIFANLICCEEGLTNVLKDYPNIKIITMAVDSQLNKDKYIIPGLGDYGDRYYST